MFVFDDDTIADTLLKLSKKAPNDNERRETIDAIYYLRTCAENPYNRDCFRVFMDVLQAIAENQ